MHAVAHKLCLLSRQIDVVPEFVSHGPHYAAKAPGQQSLVMQLEANKQIGFCLKTNFMGNSVSESGGGSASALSQSEQLL